MGRNHNERIPSNSVSIVNTAGVMLACRYGSENAISKLQNALDNGIKITCNRDDLEYYDFYRTVLWYISNK